MAKIIFKGSFLKAVVASFALLITAESLQAYPTMTRKGYTSCSTCHYNPSGGGALTSYGKYISQEVYGTFNDSSNSLPFIVTPDYAVGTFEEPYVVAMVMGRFVQTYFDTPQLRRKQLRQMQFDFEGGFAHNGWQLLGAVGPRLDSAIPGKTTKKTVDVRRYWAGRVTQEYAFRVGRFMPEYGIYHPNHNVPTRKGLFFNHNEEPEIAQGTLFSNTWDFTLGYLRGRPGTKLEDKKGYVATVAYKTGMARYGASRIDTADDNGLKAGTNGVFAQFGHGDHLYVLAEYDRKRTGKSKTKFFDEELAFIESGYEIYKAVNPYVLVEYAKNPSVTRKSPNVGLQWHPYTHLEFLVQVGKTYSLIGSENQSSTQGFFMANVYF